jgi:hypothetical protein
VCGAGDDSAVNGRSCGLLVDVKGLGIPDFREFNDLFTCNEPLVGLDDETDCVIFDVT